MSDAVSRLVVVEHHLVDWKRRAKAYEAQGVAVPAHVAGMITELKKDALLLRDQIAQQEGPR